MVNINRKFSPVMSNRIRLRCNGNGKETLDRRVEDDVFSCQPGLAVHVLCLSFSPSSRGSIQVDWPGEKGN